MNLTEGAQRTMQAKTFREIFFQETDHESSPVQCSSSESQNWAPWESAFPEEEVVMKTDQPIKDGRQEMCESFFGRKRKNWLHTYNIS